MEPSPYMYELKIISQFGAAHQLRDFGGKCENLHGHNWKIEVYVTGNELGNDGLLVDFKLIKRATEKVTLSLGMKKRKINKNYVYSICYVP